MKVSEEVAQKLRKVCAQITLEPELYDQTCYKNTLNPCDSACCIAGWLVWNENGADWFEDAYTEDIEHQANMILAPFGSSDLFRGCGEGWTAPFGGRWWSANTPQEKAAVACDRIEFFIKEGR